MDNNARDHTPTAEGNQSPMPSTSKAEEPKKAAKPRRKAPEPKPQDFICFHMEYFDFPISASYGEDDDYFPDPNEHAYLPPTIPRARRGRNMPKIDNHQYAKYFRCLKKMKLETIWKLLQRKVKVEEGEKIIITDHKFEELDETMTLENLAKEMGWRGKRALQLFFTVRREQDKPPPLDKMPELDLEDNENVEENNYDEDSPLPPALSPSVPMPNIVPQQPQQLRIPMMLVPQPVTNAVPVQVHQVQPQQPRRGRKRLCDTDYEEQSRAAKFENQLRFTNEQLQEMSKLAPQQLDEYIRRCQEQVVKNQKMKQIAAKVQNDPGYARLLQQQHQQQQFQQQQQFAQQRIQIQQIQPQQMNQQRIQANIQDQQRRMQQQLIQKQFFQHHQIQKVAQPVMIFNTAPPPPPPPSQPPTKVPRLEHLQLTAEQQQWLSNQRNAFLNMNHQQRLQQQINQQLQLQQQQQQQQHHQNLSQQQKTPLKMKSPEVHNVSLPSLEKKMPSTSSSSSSNSPAAMPTPPSPAQLPCHVVTPSPPSLTPIQEKRNSISEASMTPQQRRDPPPSLTLPPMRNAPPRPIEPPRMNPPVSIHQNILPRPGPPQILLQRKEIPPQLRQFSHQVQIQPIIHVNNNAIKQITVPTTSTSALDSNQIDLGTMAKMKNQSLGKTFKDIFKKSPVSRPQMAPPASTLPSTSSSPPHKSPSSSPTALLDRIHPAGLIDGELHFNVPGKIPSLHNVKIVH